MIAVAMIVGAYLLGAIPCGLLIGWAHGVDVRQAGSRNIGATNVGRVIGRKWGKICLALDILKGFIPTLTAALWLPVPPGPHRQLLLLAVASAAVMGHVFPVYLGFRGGKGVATTIGVALGLWPYFTIGMCAALVAYGAARYASGLVSVGSLSLAIVFPVAVVVVGTLWGRSLHEYWPMPAVALLLAAVIIVRHRENIGRLLRGAELQSPASSPKADIERPTD